MIRGMRRSCLIASALLLAESPSPTELVGMAVVVTGMLVAFRSPSVG